MRWIREGSKWLGPEGESPEFHGTKNAPGWNILKKLLMAEEMGKTPTVTDGPGGPKVEDKGRSGEDAEARAVERMVEMGVEPGDGPNLRKELFERGYVLIDDSDRNHVVAFGKDKASIVKAEDGVMRYLKPDQPVYIQLNDAQEFFLTLADVEGTASFSVAVDAAESVSHASPVPSSMDFGIWMARKTKKVKF